MHIRRNLVKMPSTFAKHRGPMKFLSTLFISLFSVLPMALTAEGLSKPSGQVILSISGELTHTNAEGVAEFDLAMLSEMPATSFETSTIWTEGVQQFTGVPLHTLLEAVGVAGTQLSASAINDYSVDIPVSDAQLGGPIVAYLRNGEEMSVRDKGPLWIVYPYDDNDDYQTETIYTRSIWQLDRIRVVK